MKRLPPGIDATLSPLMRRLRGIAAAAPHTRSDDAAIRLLVENASDMITRHGAAGDVEFASPAAGALTGVPAAELLGGGLQKRVHIADRPAYLKALSDAFNGVSAAIVEYRLRRSDPVDGERFVPVEMRCHAVGPIAGAAEGVVAVTRDISERKSRESELLGARDSAERANLAKTRFLAHMSHELRTPLNAIIGFSEILEQEVIGTLDPERRREYARLIHASGQHLLDVVNGILDMSKIESGLFNIVAEPVAVRPLIDTCCDMILGQAESQGIRLVREVPDDLPEISADRRALKLILINLLSNAVKFTDRGGTVRIAVSTERGLMAFAVSDTGIGIAAADLPRLGVPFVQADSSYERRYSGTGLGLSMVKGLAALHRGEMKIESEVGVGTTVTVTLPVEHDVAAIGRENPEEGKELKRAG